MEDDMKALTAFAQHAQSLWLDFLSRDFARLAADNVRWRVPHSYVVLDRNRAAVEVMAANNTRGHR